LGNFLCRVEKAFRMSWISVFDAAPFEQSEGEVGDRECGKLLGRSKFAGCKPAGTKREVETCGTSGRRRGCGSSGGERLQPALILYPTNS
jgi:hypothetical protein